ncbi:HNH endonuclease [Halorussus gelatinilyticus]|uniref:HNH endonuclease n=1 Tax=Halorussus gelatinilyticus TaxID=2937524 RepID=A0A8U0INB6_9EURY|nr:HNH endonuclease [Halorussus gelatinilyticus]UPW02248.1 HNH endonuclease [Halorussus gelatinilyticus]
MNDVFRIGEEYRDKGSPNVPDDEFLRPIRGSLDAGIKNTGGIRDLSSDVTDQPAALVVVSNDDGVSQHADPWRDLLATSLGRIDYWGDAKRGNPYDESPQNRKVKRAFDAAAKGNREEVPPVLVFRKPRPGVVEFCGLCVPDYFEVKQYTDGEGNRIPNYRFHFTVLNADTVAPTWLHDRVRSNSDERAPEVWREWVRTGDVKQWPTGEVVSDADGASQRDGTYRRYEREEVAVSARFRSEVLDRYGNRCVVTGIDEASLLDLAHVLPRSEAPESAEDPRNALVLNPLHHRAFDADLFTLDSERRVRVSPSFDPGHPFLRETVVERQGEAVSVPDGAGLGDEYLEARNAELGWL